MRNPTRRRRFLQMIDKVMPWQELMNLVEPFLGVNRAVCVVNAFGEEVSWEIETG